MMQNTLAKTMLAQRALLGVPVRSFAAKAQKEYPGKASGRKTANPGWYNKRFEKSQGKDADYVDYQANVRGAHGFEPRQTERDPSKFAYSNNIFKNDYWEWRMRAADYFYQIGARLHRSNDGWTRFMTGYTAFAFLMTPHALLWKFHFVFFTMALVGRIRDKGMEPTIDEVLVLDKIFGNEKLAKLFTPETYHVIDYDQEFDEGRTNPYFPEYKTPIAKFFNADTNTTTGTYKMGDVESGASMTVHFKTMPYSNNKYYWSDPFLIYDMYAEFSHNGEVSTVSIDKAEDTLKTKRIFVPWH